MYTKGRLVYVLARVQRQVRGSAMVVMVVAVVNMRATLFPLKKKSKAGARTAPRARVCVPGERVCDGARLTA